MELGQTDIINKTKDTFDTITTNGILNLLKVLNPLKGAEYSKSLPGLVKKTMVNSSVYIEDALVNHDISVPLLGTLNQIYISYILTALNLYNSVDSYSMVKSYLGRVATEGLNDHIVDIEDVINNKFGISNEDISMESENTKLYTIEDSVKHLVTGRLIEFKFNITAPVTLKDKSGNTLDAVEQREVLVPIYVQLLPIYMSNEVSKAIITLNFPMSIKQRWAQVKAREIRFFRDFILCVDLLSKHRKALRADNSNVLSDFYFKKSKNQAKYVSSSVLGQQKNNLASSMLIMTKDTFTTACADSSLDFTKFSDRQKFFNESYAMIVCIVDEMYDIVDIYYNGIQHHTEVSFKAINSVGGSKSGIDITEVMKTIAKGNAPKF
jgi:hypothetical protein